MSEENLRDGMSFIFSPVDGEGVTASGPSLAAVYSKHPELRLRSLSQVWCHCCANCLWVSDDGYGPYPEDYANGDDTYPVEIHTWREADFMETSDNSED